MTPKRIGSKNEVYKGMGLIEVDLNILESAKAWGIAGGLNNQTSYETESEREKPKMDQLGVPRNI